MTFSRMTFSIQQIDIQQNYIQYNYIQHNYIQDNDIQHNDNQHNDTQHNNTVHIECHKAECRYADRHDLFIDMPNVVILSVVMLDIMVPFTRVTYGRSKISWTVLKMFHGNTRTRNREAYLAIVVSYSRKMFMKLTTGVAAKRRFWLRH
jgi:hypothetical protein